MQDDPLKKTGGITFCSWNIRGVNEPIKRGKVLAQLKSINADVILLQETHLKDHSQTRLKANWIGQIYHSSYTSKFRATAIILRKGIPFKHKNTIADKDGRYVIVSGEIYFTPLTMVNIYAPNFDNPQFFYNILNIISDSTQQNLIIGGDFNCVLDQYLDKSSKQKRYNTKSKSSELQNTYIKH